MRVRRGLPLVIALGLVAALMGARAPAAALAACAAPITPGAWSGTFSRTVTAQGKDTRDSVHPKTTRLVETITGNLALQVACDGTVTGSLSNETLSLTITVTITNTISNKSTDINSICSGASRAAVTGGRVAANDNTSLPVFTLNATVTWDSFTCSDPNVQRLY